MRSTGNASLVYSVLKGNFHKGVYTILKNMINTDWVFVIFYIVDKR